MNKSLLFISIEYPPKAGPGACRNFFFCKDLADIGWKIDVLTIKEDSISSADNSFNNFETKAHIHRSTARDSTKTFSFFGKYPKFIEIPDRWFLWLFSAIPKGLSIIKKNSPDLIYVSYPSYTNLLVAVCLHKLTNKKLILELRDPFRYRYDGKNMPCHWLYRWIERASINSAHKVITTTTECANLYSKDYKHKEPIACFKNGFVPEIHSHARVNVEPTNNPKFTLLHSGSLYHIGRNPLPILKAINILKKGKQITKDNFELVFRGSDSWPELTSIIGELNISELISFKPNIPYIDSITEMYQSSAIIIIQECIFNAQIPSKAYDSLATGKPIIAITPKKSSLCNELEKNGHYFNSENEVELANYIRTQIQCSSNIVSRDYKQLTRHYINRDIAKFLNE